MCGVKLNPIAYESCAHVKILGKASSGQFISSSNFSSVMMLRCSCVNMLLNVDGSSMIHFESTVSLFSLSECDVGKKDKFCVLLLFAISGVLLMFALTSLDNVNVYQL